MSSIVEFFRSLVGNEPYLLWLIVFAATASVIAASTSAFGEQVLRRRLKRSIPQTAGEADPSPLAFADPALTWLTRLQPLYGPFVPGRPEVAGEIRQRLNHAGMRNPRAVEIFFALRIVLALTLGALAVFILPLLFPTLKVAPLLMIAILGAMIGYLAPGYVVSWLGSRRKTKITDGFPDALDMMLVCVESGLSLEASIQRVGQEIRNAHPIIAEEFRLVGNEMLAGKTRHDALRQLAERTGVADVRSLVSLLIQSDQFGTSVAKALRIHAFEMRSARILRAEERAHKIPVKLAFPLMFGLIPVVLIITLAPGILRVIGVLMPLMSKGKFPTPHH